MEKWMKGNKMNFLKPKGKSIWSVRERAMPVKLFGDKDRDKVMNIFDCRPNNKRRQGFLVPVYEQRKIKRYIPQVQSIVTKMVQQQNKNMNKIMEYHKKAYSSVGTKGQQEKLRRMQNQRQVEDTGLFDFRVIPGIEAEGPYLPPKPDYKTQFKHVYKEKKLLPMHLIVDKGIVKGEIVTKRRNPRVVELKSIYVLPEYRNQGLGKKVIRSLYKHPTTQAISGVAIPEAKEYWQKMGAKQTHSPEEEQAWDEHIKQATDRLLEELDKKGIRPEQLTKEQIYMAEKDLNESGWPNVLEKEDFEKLNPIEKEKPMFKEVE